MSSHTRFKESTELLLWFMSENLQQLANAVVTFCGVTQWEIAQHHVFIAATYFGHLQVPSLFQVGHNAVCGAFGDPYFGRNVSNSDLRLCGNGEKHMGMIRQERPRWFWRRLHAFSLAYLLSFDT
jgi:hypothetical protein